ncbi:hypothetical protein QZH56_09225 [Streptomyces olivoreticuli]|uniref:hypothetical protein n=1 Tax=Streptomyces olivoreticuli TaxID=68246 RepID=UPI002659EFEB|nr:hypothetical protein [Streptomyces olivoreticuli]WKK25749.1 hypothetical protein QZH56_09225 [Streptomyces olivoreticuli]
MSGVGITLGPLELIDGRCVVGDSRRPDGSWVEFRAEGLYRHAPGSEGELVPWSRIMLGMRVIVGRGHPAKGGNFTMPGLLGGLPGFKGRGGGHLDMTLRHPYEDWSARFDRHTHGYRLFDVTLLEELLRQTVAAGEAHRLADADWLGRVVVRLTAPRSWVRTKLADVVEQARQAEGTSTG